MCGGVRVGDTEHTPGAEAQVRSHFLGSHFKKCDGHTMNLEEVHSVTFRSVTDWGFASGVTLRVLVFHHTHAGYIPAVIYCYIF